MTRRGGPGRRILGRRARAGPDAATPAARGRTLRRIAGFFRPYRWRLAFIAVLILVTVSIGVVNPILLKLVIDNLTGPAGPGPAVPPVRADDRAADHHQRARRLAVVPVERRRPAGHERPAPRAVPPPPVDAAALLHRDADRRDPEPDRQRRRRGAVGRDRYGRIGPEQRRDRGDHGHRDGDPRLAAHGPEPGPAAGLRLHHLPRRQGPASGQHAHAALDGRDERHHRGVAQRVGDPAQQDVRAAGGIRSSASAPSRSAWATSRCAAR